MTQFFVNDAGGDNKFNEILIISTIFLIKYFVNTIYPPKNLSFSFCDWFYKLEEKGKKSGVPELALVSDLSGL